MKKAYYVAIAGGILCVLLLDKACVPPEAVEPNPPPRSAKSRQEKVIDKNARMQSGEIWQPTSEEQKELASTEAVLHGKVVDQFNQPVSNAEIVCLPNPDPTISGLRRVVIHSAKDGTFSLWEPNAPMVRVNASAPGYYTSTSSSGFFSFAKAPATAPEDLRRSVTGTTKTSPENPAILTLRKMGAREPLLQRSHAGVLKDQQSYRIGTKANQCVQVKYWFDPSPKRVHANGWTIHDWSVEISVEGGGIIGAAKPDASVPESFVAPLEGYQESIRFAYESSMDDSKLQNEIRPEFFVIFADETFARMETRFSASPSWPFGTILSWYNPSGSRSAEFDASIQIDVPPEE